MVDRFLIGVEWHFIGNFGKMRSRITAWVIFLGVFVGNSVGLWRNGEGGVKFGFEGKTYSFSTKDCSGGVLFKKPVDLDFVCPRGYFLQRPKGCSSSHEVIVGGKKLSCPDLKGDERVRVQAFIPVTNPGAPTEHTIAIYDDENTLKGFKRFTLRVAKSKGYVGQYNGSRFMVVSNPRKIAETSIGPVCYRGINGANGASYKVRIKGNLKGFKEKSFFQSGCDAQSVSVEWKVAHKFALTDGFSNRFKRSTAKMHLLENPGEVSNHDDTTVASNSATEKSAVFQNVRNVAADKGSSARKANARTDSGKGLSNSDLSVDSAPNSSKDAKEIVLSTAAPESNATKVVPREKATGDSHVKEDASKLSPSGKLKKFNKMKHKNNEKFEKYEGGPKGKKPKGWLKGGRTLKQQETKSKRGLGIRGRTLQKQTTKNPKEVKSALKPKSFNTGWTLPIANDTEEIIDNWEAMGSEETRMEGKLLFHKPPEPLLKETIVVGNDRKFVSPYFLEVVAIGRIRVGELLSGKNLSDPDEPTLFRNKKSNSLKTKWFGVMKKQVEVVETIVPQAVVPRGLFQDALNVFSFMFRNLPDNERLEPNSEHGDLKALLDSLSACQKEYETNPVKIEYDNASLTCPPRMISVHENPSFLWNPAIDAPQDLSKLSELEFPDRDPIRFRHKTFPGKTNLIIQLMFTVMDIAHVACFKSFDPTRVNLHSKMTFYLMSNVFLSPEVHEYWKQGDVGPDVFASLLPNWNPGKSFHRIGHELDMIRLELRKATVHHSWITTDPNKYSMKKIPVDGSELSMENSYGNTGQRKARQRVEELIRDLVVFRKPYRSESSEPDLADSEKVTTEEVAKTTEVATPPPEAVEDGGEPERTPDEAAGRRKRSIRETREGKREKLKHREIWNGLAYCLSLKEEVNEKGQTRQLGIHPSLEILQTEVAC